MSQTASWASSGAAPVVKRVALCAFVAGQVGSGATALYLLATRPMDVLLGLIVVALPIGIIIRAVRFMRRRNRRT